MSTNPWGSKIGTWAEQAEEEERQQLAAAAASSTDPQSFPSLKEAASSKPKKKKTVMSLSEFVKSSPETTSSRLTPAEMMQLPTGPKQRTGDEYVRPGGFSGYSGGRGGDSEGNWGRRSGFEEDDRRGARRGADFEDRGPSRADEVDNWARDKRAVVDSGPGRVNSYESLGVGSRADDVDNWAIGKKPVVGAAGSRSIGGFGLGFRDSGGDGGMDSDRWRRGGDVRESAGGGERQRLVLEPRRVSIEGSDVGTGNLAPVVVVARTERSNPFGAARPREEVLAEKGLDWKKLDLEIEGKKSSSSRPGSSQGSRPSSVQSNRSEGVGVQGVGPEQVVVKPRPKVNPFGDAKPREVLLVQKGKDWRKMDLELEHRGVDRIETEEEKVLKQELEQLKQELSNVTSQELSADQSSLRDLISSRERALELLVRELDDKVRFGTKALERPGSAASRPGSGAGRPTSGAGRPGSGAGRPGSGAGRYGSFSDIPPSQSGSSEDLRGGEYVDRPRSRGTDIWTRPGEGGGFYGSRDRGFLANREYDRRHHHDASHNHHEFHMSQAAAAANDAIFAASVAAVSIAV
ncbi:Eukaryotic translation initiation factor 4B1-like protein [Drosera capensis]